MAAGTTKTELPRRGEILRYVYLFHRESRDRDEGVKERPVVVIDADPATRRVAVLAVTTKGERNPATIALPDAVAENVDELDRIAQERVDALGIAILPRAPNRPFATE